MKQKFKGPHSAHSMGGKTAAANMTPAQLSARGRKAVAAREEKRRLQKEAA